MVKPRLDQFPLDVTGLGDTFPWEVSLSNFERAIMKPVSRHPVNKYRSSKQFGHHTRTVASANIQHMPMRGGWRL